MQEAWSPCAETNRQAGELNGGENWHLEVTASRGGRTSAHSEATETSRRDFTPQVWGSDHVQDQISSDGSELAEADADGG